MSTFDEYENHDGMGLAELVATGQLSAVELLEAAIARADARNPPINAILTRIDDAARAAAASLSRAGPLAGVPFLIKDLGAAMAGVPMQNGSRFMTGYLPQEDDEIVRRYRAAGLILFGRTNTPEFGLAPVTEPVAFGPARNPWDTARTPGGSSGGSAAAVAAGIVPLAHASDGGGSIRIPASCCGLFGLKPTRARTPLGPGAVEGWQGLVSQHVVSRSVRDSAAALDATHGPETGAPYPAPPPERPYLEEVGRDPGRLRIAFSAAPPLAANVHEDVRAALADAVAQCADLGHEVEEAHPEIDGAALAEAFIILLGAETALELDDTAELIGRRPRHGEIENETRLTGLLGDQFSAHRLSWARRVMMETGIAVGRFLESYDVLVTPTLAQPPLLIGALEPPASEVLVQDLLARFRLGALVRLLGGIERTAARLFNFIPYTPVYNVSGHPAASIPLHWNDDGLPIGVQFVARFGDEGTLFRLAAQLETARPWFHRRPPLAA